MSRPFFVSIIAPIAGLAVLVACASSAAAQTYTEPVQLPDCDANDSETKIIENASDFDAVNDSSLRIFCVTPGDYSSAGVIELRESGRQQQRRYLRYYDPSNPNQKVHPTDVGDGDRAIVRGLHLLGAEHWTVHGLTSRAGDDRQNPTNRNIHFGNGAADNILDYLLVERGRGTLVDFRSGASDNSFQNSVVRWTQIIPNDDNMCANFSGENTERNRIVRSELYECAGDSIHVSPSGPGNNAGSLIANNDLYITPDLYSDCNGNRTPNGDCACAENAIDVKAVQGGDSSSEPEEDWLKILDNRMWGWRNTDTQCGSTGSSGAVVTVHFSRADFILAKGNILFDAPVGWTFSASGSNNVSLLSNIFYDIDRLGLIMHHKSESVESYYNTLVDIGEHYLNVARAPANNAYKCTTAIDGNQVASGGSNARSGYNAYFNTDPFHQSSNDLTFSSASDANAEKFCFERRLWTKQETVCIPHVLKTDQSPHKDHCDPNLGSQSGVGINDTTDKSFFKKNWSNYGGFSVDLAADPSRGPTALEVDFDASPAGGEAPYSYAWDFDDGASANGPSPTHTFDDPGTYDVEVVVEDDGGQTASASTRIDVLDPDALVFSPVPYFGNAANWEAREASRWRVEKQGGDKRLFLHTSSYSGEGNQPGEFVLARDRQFDEFTLTFDYKTNEDIADNEGADFVVVFGWQDADNYHFILGHHQAQYAQLFRIDDGERSLVEKLGEPLLPDEQWHEIRVANTGERVEIELDGRSITAIDSDVRRGRLGVGAFNESVYFDDIDVESPGDGERADTDPMTDGGGMSDTGPSPGPDTGTRSDDSTADTIGQSDADADDDENTTIRSDGTCGCASPGQPTAPALPIALFVLGTAGLRHRLTRKNNSPTRRGR